jgi:TPR repeat protein
MLEAWRFCVKKLTRPARTEDMTVSKLVTLTASLLFAAPTAFAAMTAAELEEFDKANAYYAEQNYKKAFKEYRDLARNGNKNSQQRLAQMYVDGLGVKQDPEEAYAWSVLAAQDNGEAQVAYRDNLWARLGESEQKGAQKTADKYMSKYSNAALAEKADIAAARAERDNLSTCVGSRMKRNCR